MAQIKGRVEGGVLYIGLAGRIDAANAADVEAQIAAVKEENKGLKTVLDADELQYISSAGLRVVLRLRKEDAELSVINVSPEVYEVFDMTGFTDMMTVEKAYPRMSVEGCEFIAKGANGAVYRYDEETIIKTYYNPDALPEIQQEREMARKAFVLGINTAMPYGIVRVDGGYGTITELLNAVSVTKMIRANANDLDTPAGYYIGMIKNIHSIEVERGEVPEMHETALKWAEFVAPELTEEHAEKLCALIRDLPIRNNMLHGDYHSNNVMVKDGEALLIDMDTLCMGHPVFELGSMFNAYIGFTEVDEASAVDFFGFGIDVCRAFWKKSLALYLETEDEARIDDVQNKAMIIGYTRMLRRAMRRPNEEGSAMRIARCKEQLAMLLEKVDTLDF